MVKTLRIALVIVIILLPTFIFYCIPTKEQDLYLIDPAVLRLPTDNMTLKLHVNSTAALYFSWDNPLRPDHIASRIFINDKSYDASDATEFVINIDDASFASGSAITWYVEVYNAIYKNKGQKRSILFNLFQTITTQTTSTSSTTDTGTTTSTSTTLTTTTLTSTTLTTTTLTSTSTTRSTTTQTTVTTQTTRTTTTTLPLADGRLIYGGTGFERFSEIKKTPDGGYIIVGRTTSSNGTFSGQGAHGGDDAYVLKLTSDGRLDTGFAGDGVLLIGTSGGDYGNSVCVLSGGGYAVGGLYGAGDGDFASEGFSGGAGDGFVIKLTSTGAFDTSFSGNGILKVASSSHDEVSSVLEMSPGTLLFAGHFSGADNYFAGQPYQGGYDFFFSQVQLGTGSLDTTFNGSGIKAFGSSSTDFGLKAFKTYDGKIFAEGQIYAGDGDFASQGFKGGSDIALIKVLANGSFDTSFSSDGRLVIGSTSNDQSGFAIETGTGAVFISGSFTGSNGDFTGEPIVGSWESFVIKLTASGAFDTSFSGNGILTFGSSGADYSSSVSVDPANKVYVIGYTGSVDGSFAGEANGGGQEGYVVKLASNGSFDNTFDGNGIKMYGGSGSEWLQGNSFYEATDKLIIGGFSDSSNGNMAGQGAPGNYSFFLFRINTADGSF